METYQPPPRKAPLLLRPARWSGGLPVAAVVLASFAGVPLVYGGRLIWVAIAALLSFGD